MSRHVIDNPSFPRGAGIARALVLIVALCVISSPAVIRAAVDQIVPVSVSGELGAGAHAEFPQIENRHISDDGRFVAFTSFGTNLVPGQVDTNGRRDVFLYDRGLDSVQMVSHSTAGLTTASNRGGLTGALVSGDGAYVLFNSESVNLIAGVSDGNNGSDVFLWERATGTVTLVSHAAGSPTTTGNSFSSIASISDDGAYVSFETSATDMVAGATTNTWVDVFVWERTTGDVTLVSHTHSSSTTEGNLFSYKARISGDGSWVAFVSGSTDLISGSDTNSADDLFLWERDTGLITLISHADGFPTTTGSTWSADPSISNDGAFVAYRSRAADLVSGDTNGVEDIFHFDRVTGSNVLVSHTGAVSGNGSSSEPRLSGNGSWVAFSSAATDLAPGSDTNGQNDVFLYEHATGTVTLVSHTAGAPTDTGNERSYSSSIADDGSWVAYLSRATDLVSATDDNGGGDIFLFNRSTGANTLVSHSASSTNITGDATSDAPALAAGAASVYFRSKARDLVAGVAFGSSDFAFVHDRASGLNAPVSRVDFGVLPFTANDISSAPSISDDGRFVTFLSEALDLIPGQQDIPETEDVFLYDSFLGTVTLVSHIAGNSIRTGLQAGNHASLDPPLISGDGAFVVFQSFAPDLVAGSDTNDDTDLFLWERATGGVRLISHAGGSMTTAANNESGDASMNTDGSYVVFETRASDMGTTDSNFTDDVYLWERASGTLTLVSHAIGSATTTADGFSRNPVVSGDGLIVGFISFASNLVAGLNDINLDPDTYVWQRSAGVVRLVGHVPASDTQTPDDFGSSEPVVSRDGAYVAFRSNSEELVTGTDTNSATDIFLWDWATGTVRLVSHVAGIPTTAGDSWSDSQVIANDGAYVTFRSRSTDLQAGITDTNNEYDIYQWHRAGDISTLISHTAADVLTAGNGVSSEPTMSSDGAWVAFSSHATNLWIGSDSNAGSDSFRWDRAANEISLLSHQLGDPTRTGAGSSFSPMVSHTGAFVTFVSQANDLVANDFGNINDVFLFGDDLDTDLAVSMTAYPEPVGLGWEVTWTIDVTNNGPGAAARVLVRDPLPAGVTFTGAGGTDWVCDVQKETVACLLLGLESGNTAPSLDISGIAPMTPGILQNTVTATSSAADPSASNDSSTVDSNVQVMPPRVVNVAGDPNAGTLDECQSTSQVLDSLTLTFSQTMSNLPGDGLTDPDNYQLVSAGPDRDLQTVACGGAAGDDVLVPIAQVTTDGTLTEAELQPATVLGEGLYRVFACASLADDGGSGLDGDGDGFSGGDFSRQFRVDLGNLLTNGALDCNLDNWTQVEEDAAEVAHDTADIDNASASGSARALNLVASELGLFQCLQTDLPTLNLLAFVRVEDATDLVGHLECFGYDQPNCRGLVLGEDTASTSLAEDPGVWRSLDVDLTVPAGASIWCGVAFETPGSLPFEAFLDNLVVQETPLFSDGFESGDTTAWSNSVP